METFKDVERENKTKPHSKQGLLSEEKMDPKEKEKAETLDWLNVTSFKVKIYFKLYLFRTKFERFKKRLIDRNPKLNLF